jgi:hypothetical protein
MSTNRNAISNSEQTNIESDADEIERWDQEAVCSRSVRELYPAPIIPACKLVAPSLEGIVTTRLLAPRSERSE